MPNIEIRGFDDLDAVKLGNKIIEKVKMELFCNAFRMTILASCYTDVNMKKLSCVRVCSSELTHNERIIEILQEIQKNEGIEFDIEVLPLELFIPAKK